MTNFKAYFRLHLKADIKPFIYILAVVLVLTFLMGMSLQPVERFDHFTGKLYIEYHSTLYIPVVFLCILTYVLPVMEFSFFKKRIHLDCAYSLPISRRTMGIVHYLTGLIILFCAFSYSYLLNFAMLIGRGTKWFNFAPMASHYLLCLLLGFSMYSVMVFVFNRANTRGDGIWFMILYTFVFCLVISAYAQLVDNWYWSEAIYPAVLWGVIDTMTVAYQRVVEISEGGSVAELWQMQKFVTLFVFWVLAGIASAAGLYFTFGKRRMEITEEISDSFFGFRTLIPIYAVTGMIVFEVSDSIISWVIIELFALLGYTIYRRGFHYKKSDIAILCALAIFLFI